MPIERWSDSILLVHMADDPQMSEDMEQLDDAKSTICSTNSIVMDYSTVRYITSSNIAKLLKVRRKVLQADHRLVLCNVSNQVWSTFLTTGLDKIFEFSENVPTGLATVQMSSGGRRKSQEPKTKIDDPRPRKS